MSSPYDKIADKFIKSTDAAPKKNFTDSFRPPVPTATPQPVAPPPMPMPVPTPMPPDQPFVPPPPMPPPQEAPKVGFLEGALAMALGQLEKRGQRDLELAEMNAMGAAATEGLPPVLDVLDAGAEIGRQATDPVMHQFVKSPFSAAIPGAGLIPADVFNPEFAPEIRGLASGELPLGEALPLERFRQMPSTATGSFEEAKERDKTTGFLGAFEERPWWDKLFTGAVYDPLNLLPAPVGLAPRLGTLGTGIGKMVGQLMDVYRIAAQADKALILRQVGQMFKGGVLAPGQMLTGALGDVGDLAGLRGAELAAKRAQV